MRINLKYYILQIGTFFVSDKMFSQAAHYYLHFRRGYIPKRLNLKNPKTFNEKILWNKLNIKFKGGALLADKFEVRKFITKTIGEKYLIPIIGIYQQAEDIDFDALPMKFVVKITQASGLNIIVKDKSKIDSFQMKKTLNHWLKIDYSIFGREWQYDIKTNKILIEHLIANNTNDDLKDYKYYCFNGMPKLIQVDSERYEGVRKRDFFDLHWNKQEFTISHQITKEKMEKPNNLLEMNQVAFQLSNALKNKMNFVRIDLYNIEGQIYFGEITFHPGGGCSPFSSYEYDLKLGEMIELKTNITK
tara:strand:+ start:8208 stop:9116 length:909 start_codon:yes stop_codon:yes gene_type:complete